MAGIVRGDDLYKQLRTLLRERIASGEYAPGSLLPSEPALAQEYDVSRNTVRLALNSLRAEGLIGVRNGKGSFVREVSADPARTIARSTADPAEALTGTTEPMVGQAELDARTATRLGAQTGDQAFIREDSYSDDGTVIIRRFLPLAVADGTPLQDAPFPDRAELVAILTAAYGKLTETEYVRARLPSADDSVRLALDEPVPVLEITRVASAKARPLFAEVERRIAEGVELGYRLR